MGIFLTVIFLAILAYAGTYCYYTYADKETLAEAEAQLRDVEVLEEVTKIQGIINSKLDKLHK